MSVKGTTAQMTTPSHARIVRRAPTHVIAKTDIKGKTVQVWLFLQSVIKCFRRTVRMFIQSIFANAGTILFGTDVLGQSRKVVKETSIGGNCTELG